ncbi:hypothetical protein pdam_00019873 [Paramuricea clavata]|uniref:SAM domain-containing protein n=1 Tax=Paramuricea clavata TaxID=317549 RepID=A0A7D9L3I3_PARCT|nr:hypothetical protein pdam_00019873 [Paramuricea clavata]
MSSSSANIDEKVEDNDGDVKAEKISGKSLLSIEKSDLKEMGIKTLGKRIELMTKIDELLHKGSGDVVTQVSSGNIQSFKRKITKLDKESWDEKTKNEYLEK